MVGVALKTQNDRLSHLALGPRAASTEGRLRFPCAEKAVRAKQIICIDRLVSE